MHLVHVTGMVTGLDARLTSAPGLAVAGLDSPGWVPAAAGPRTLRDIPNEVASSPAITPCPAGRHAGRVRRRMPQPGYRKWGVSLALSRFRRPDRLTSTLVIDV